MTDAPRRLRLWPGIAAVALLFFCRFGLKQILTGPDGFVFVMKCVLGCAIAVLLWWLFLSRAAWVERWVGFALLVGSLVAAVLLGHESMLPAVATYGVAFHLLAFVLCVAVTRHLPDVQRRTAIVATILVSSGFWVFVRTDGVDGENNNSFAWRWSKTTEQRLLARGAEPMSRLPAAAVPGAQASWPGFRGSGRDGVIRGVRISTDWSESPPVELWRRPVGPGWSSFAVRGGLVYTQEQLGEHEVVTAYGATTGKPVWRHRDVARFYEAQGGGGPRATPTVEGNRVYTLGATGILNALDADDGELVWSRDVATDAGSEVPYWGFSSSPLVVDDLVVVDGGKLIAYDRITGEPRWFGPESTTTYSSPHLVTLDGVPQILFLRAGGSTSLLPSDGSLLWEHAWPGFTVAQPAMTPDGDILMGANQYGTRRITVTQGSDGWSAEERWTSTELKPYFNDFVLHEGHAYGFDGRILAGIDLETGERAWKGSRYGHGQLVLLADQDLLLVLSERGELALVSATPEGFTELGRVPALDGKTWNHPVLVGDLLLVRNGEEMAAFRLNLDQPRLVNTRK